MVVEMVSGLLSDGLSWALSNWPVAIGAIALLLLVLSFVIGARENGPTSQNAGAVAEMAFGGVVGSTTSLVVLLLGAVTGLGKGLLMGFAELNAIVDAPGLVGQAVVAALGYAGLAGYIPLTAETFGWAAILLTVLVGLLRYGDDIFEARGSRR